VKRYWTDEELAEHWSLSTAELEILPDRGDHNRLGFAILLTFIEIAGCFSQLPARGTRRGTEPPSLPAAHPAHRLYSTGPAAPANAIARASALFSAFGRSVSATLSHCGIGSKLKEVCSNQHISALSDGPW
jgi:hypothetical protein